MEKGDKAEEDKVAKAEKKSVRMQDEVERATYRETNAKQNADFLRDVKNRVMHLLLGVPVPPDFFATVLSSLVDYEPVDADATELGAQMMVLNYIQNPDMDVDLALLVSQLPEHYEYVNTIRVVAAKMFQSKEGAAIVMKAALEYPHEFSEWLPEAAYKTPDEAYPPLFTYWSEFWFKVDVGDDTPQQVKIAIANGESKETFIRDLAVKWWGENKISYTGKLTVDGTRTDAYKYEGMVIWREGDDFKSVLIYDVFGQDEGYSCEMEGRVLTFTGADAVYYFHDF